MSALPLIVVWEPDEPGLRGTDLVRLAADGDGVRADGCVAAVEEPDAWGVRFELTADARWRTRTLAVESLHADAVRRRTLTADGEGSWWIDGVVAPHLDGCLDVDLEATPFTNTLPIRRLGLAVGEHAEILAAWVGVHELDVQTRSQAYRRLDANRYEYHSLASGYRAELVVDEHGLVVAYSGVARRIYP